MKLIERPLLGRVFEVHGVREVQVRQPRRRGRHPDESNQNHIDFIIG